MASPKTVGILVARMSSSRLPGKALRKVHGKPLIGYCLEQLRAVSELDEIWLATTDHTLDEPLVSWAQDHDIHVLAYPGAIEDVVGRVTAVVKASGAERILWVLGDSPWADPRLMRRFLKALDDFPAYDAVEVALREGHPSVHCGIGCYRRKAWLTVDSASQMSTHREHLGSVLKDQPVLLNMGYLEEDALYFEVPCRLSIDTEADLTFFGQAVQAVGQPDSPLILADLLQLLKHQPDLAVINRHVRQKTLSEVGRKILMVVQAGHPYGYGHLSRCQTLAKALEEYFSIGVTWWVQTVDPDLITRLAQNGRSVRPPNESLSEAIQSYAWDGVVIDIQDPLTPDWMAMLRMQNPELPVIVLDNAGPGVVEATAIIFPNAHHFQPLLPVEACSVPCFSGPPYVLLGPAFSGPVPEDPPASELRVLVTMGGSDPNGLTRVTLTTLQALSGVTLDVVIPATWPNEAIDSLHAAISPNMAVMWHVQMENLRPLMAQATVAIAGFGVTAYELAFMGIPAILVPHHARDKEALDYFTHWGSAIALDLADPAFATRLVTVVQDLLGDAPRRQTMKIAGQALVDGQGAFRVAECVVQ